MDKKHHIAIYTTASIPWLTGTSINPLFRAAYLAKDGEQKVTLVIPWLPLKDQEHVFPSGVKFNSHLEQEKCVRQWLEERTGFASNFSIRFYPGKFSLDKRSILALGDITVIIPDDEADVAVLEEPEHLTWFHHGKRWKKKFRLVVGIVHTNYLEYVKRERNAVEAFFLKQINSWVVDLYCHKVIRLSAATQDLPRSLVCNVHGVNPKFLQIGMKAIEKQQNDNQTFSKGVYYIGKMLWSKGYKELLRLLRDHQKELAGLEIDLYGSGEDSAQIEVAFKKDGASKKLSTIVEGESMMNDGAAIVVYQLFYRMVLGKSSGCVAVLEYLAEGSLGSVLIGIVFGMASLLWLRFIYNDTLTDFSLALTVSYIAYYTAQEEAEASGILTLVALGMVFAMSKDTHRAGGKQSLHEFWEMIAYIANTLIFILSGVIIAQSIFSIGNLENNTGC